MPLPSPDPQATSWGTLVAGIAGFLALLKKLWGVNPFESWFRPRDPDCEAALAAMAIRVNDLQDALSKALISLARQEEHSKWQDVEIDRLKNRNI